MHCLKFQGRLIEINQNQSKDTDNRIKCTVKERGVYGRHLDNLFIVKSSCPAGQSVLYTCKSIIVGSEHFGHLAFDLSEYLDN